MRGKYEKKERERACVPHYKLLCLSLKFISFIPLHILPCTMHYYPLPSLSPCSTMLPSVTAILPIPSLSSSSLLSYLHPFTLPIVPSSNDVDLVLAVPGISCMVYGHY